LIETLNGRVGKICPRGLVLQVGSIGFFVQVTNPLKFATQEDLSLKIYWHWNSEKGPSLYGFVTEIEKEAFAMLLECPKVGPQIALQLLSQASVEQLLKMLALGDEHSLSKLSGIGPKKSKTLVLELQEKASRLLAELKLDPTSNLTADSLILDEAISALKSMGYVASEIATAISHIDKEQLANSDFASLTRMLLAQLLRQKNSATAPRN
jgi:Holliday junction DNA helicase RuvA